ncbi:hypothetical protein F7984_17640 [Pradoshia sp. D12]|uniref:hypothetical protein n=1 Tax=Bacillaceae TaxID=186817 RepID=UPI00112DD9D7|nr:MULTISPECIES: hypothetical protein [Bacillaceae]QFK72918.1 hypothetical protein F7984_17640 [Pradoshia sp. D12]TPF71910.1 hypothetical protein FHY44_10335 [Bacillus sp. D12]
MKIIEKTIVGKRPAQLLCEDGLFIGEHFIAVIDGVTSKGELLWEGQTSGVYAKNLVIDYLKNAPFDSSAQQLIEDINQFFYEEIKKKQVANDIKEHLRVSIIVFSKYRQEIWSYGDCQCMINGQLFDHTKKIDALIANIRSFTIQALLKDGVTIKDLQVNDISRQLILPFLEIQQLLENSHDEFGYPVINGGRLIIDYLQSYKVKAGDEIVLASDGFPRLFSSLTESESYLSRVITEDPLCYSLFKSTKGVSKGNYSYDDRVYVKFMYN